MATNPTVEGDGTALHISNLLAEFPSKSRDWPAGSRPAVSLSSRTRRSWPMRLPVGKNCNRWRTTVR